MFIRLGDVETGENRNHFIDRPLGAETEPIPEIWIGERTSAAGIAGVDIQPMIAAGDSVLVRIVDREALLALRDACSEALGESGESDAERIVALLDEARELSEKRRERRQTRRD